MTSRIIVLALGLVAGCSSHDPAPELSRDPPRQRRVIEPPAGTVRVLPPYAIRADGVGPYRLAEKLSEMGDQLPSGLRLPLFDIPGVIHRTSIPVENNTILIGGDPTSTASSIAVLGPEVARTESGIHVGSTREELVAALGPLVDDPDVARDQHVVVVRGFPTARMLFEGDRIGAIVVTSDPAVSTRAPGSTEPTCARPASTTKGLGTCFTGAGELLETDGDDLTVRAPDSERVVASLRISNLVFAAPLRNPADGRDELLAVTRTDEPSSRTWSVVGYRFEGAKLVRVVDPTPVYVVTTSTARWIGAELREVDLFLELVSRSDAVEVGGLLTTRPDGARGWRDVVVISTSSVVRRRGKPVAADVSDAGVGDTLRGSGSGAGPAKP